MLRKQKSVNSTQPYKTHGKPGLLQLVLAGVLVFPMGGGIVIGYLNFFGLPGINGDTSEAANREGPAVVLDLDTIIVNLADPGGNRYLKAGIVFQYPKNDRLTGELKEKNHEIVDKVITILRNKTVDQIQPVNKVEELKVELINSVNEHLENGEITQLYFTEYIIQ